MLQPFNSKNVHQHVEWLVKLQYEPFYRNFFRFMERTMNYEDAYNIEKSTRYSCLCYYEDDILKGMTTIDWLNWGVCEIGFFILPEFIKTQAGVRMNLEVEAFLKQKNIRKIKGHILQEDSHLTDICIKFGYEAKCILEKETMINGKEMNVILIEKFI